jgi:hypothetical protein
LSVVASFFKENHVAISTTNDEYNSIPYLIKIRCMLYFYDILIVDNAFFNMWYKSNNLVKSIRPLPAITLAGW